MNQKLLNTILNSQVCGIRPSPLHSSLLHMLSPKVSVEFLIPQVYGFMRCILNNEGLIWLSECLSGLKISTLQQETLWNPKRITRSVRILSFQQPTLGTSVEQAKRCITASPNHPLSPWQPSGLPAQARLSDSGRGRPSFSCDFSKQQALRGSRQEGPRGRVYSILPQQDALGPPQYRVRLLFDLIIFLVQPKEQEKEPLGNLIIFRSTSLSNLNVPFFSTLPKAQGNKYSIEDSSIWLQCNMEMQ